MSSPSRFTSTIGTILAGVTVSVCPTRSNGSALMRRSCDSPRSLRRKSSSTGRTIFVGSDVKSIGRALTGNRNGVAVVLSGREGEVLVDLDAPGQAAPGDVLLGAYLRTAVSAIRRRGKARRKLQEFNIVRDLHNHGRSCL